MSKGKLLKKAQNCLFEYTEKVRLTWSYKDCGNNKRGKVTIVLFCGYRFAMFPGMPVLQAPQCTFLGSIMEQNIHPLPKQCSDGCLPLLFPMLLNSSSPFSFSCFVWCGDDVALRKHSQRIPIPIPPIAPLPLIERACLSPGLCTCPSPGWVEILGQACFSFDASSLHSSWEINSSAVSAELVQEKVRSQLSFPLHLPSQGSSSPGDVSGRNMKWFQFLSPSSQQVLSGKYQQSEQILDEKVSCPRPWPHWKAYISVTGLLWLTPPSSLGEVSSACPGWCRAQPSGSCWTRRRR